MSDIPSTPAPLTRKTAKESLAPVFAVLASAGILITGHGLLGLLVPIRADLEAFTTLTIGLLGSAYFAGFLIAGIMTPRLIARVGHIRTFAISAAFASSASVSMLLLVEPWSWTLSRVIFGGAMASMYMVMESWLNECSSNESRGFVFGVYMIINFAALSGGQLFLTFADPSAIMPFLVVAMLVTLSLVPVSLTRATSPVPLTRVRVRIGALWQNSPVAFAGCILCGAAHGAFWMLGPLFGGQLGFDTAQIAQFIAASVIGGALAQVPIGALSDRIDRRLMLSAVAIAAIGSGLALLTAQSLDATHLRFLGLAVLFGASLLPLYSLLVAHANDYAEADDFVNISSGLLLLFGLGSMLGPAVAASVMERYGPAGFIGTISAILIVLIVFALYRVYRHPSLPQAEKEKFIASARTTYMAYELDPRGEEQPDESEAGSLVGDGAPLTFGASDTAEAGGIEILDPRTEESTETIAMANPSITAKDGSGSFGGYLALPPSGTGPGLVVIQEIFGVNKVMRDIVDDFAAQGFVAFCPDIFWRIQPGIDITDQTQEEWQQAFDYFGKFDQEKGVEDLQAAVDFLRNHEATNGKVGAVGFCLGGRMAARMALDTDVDGSVGYYGVGLEDFVDRVGDLKAPLMLHVAEEDSFVPKDAQAKFKEAFGKSDKVTIYTYPGKEHAFARKGGEHYDAEAAQTANQRTMDFFQRTVF